MKTLRELLTKCRYKTIFNSYYKLFLKQKNLSNSAIIEADLYLSKFINSLKSLPPNGNSSHELHVTYSEGEYGIHCDVDQKCLDNESHCPYQDKIDLLIRHDFKISDAELSAVILYYIAQKN